MSYQDDDVSPREQVSLECAQAEYNRLQDYYKETLLQRKHLFNYYFRSVTLPSAIVGIAGIYSDNMDKFYFVGGVLLMFVFLTGFYLFLTYCKEAKNAELFHNAMSHLRRQMATNNLTHATVFRLVEKSDVRAYCSAADEQHVSNVLPKNWFLVNARTQGPQGIKWDRGRAMVAINSGIGSFALLIITAWLIYGNEINQSISFDQFSCRVEVIFIWLFYGTLLWALQVCQEGEIRKIKDCI